jgi:hypothetical protein
MATWTFNVKFPYDTQFTFRSMMFVVGEDRNLKMLAPGSAPEHLMPVYRQAPYLLAISSTSAGAYSGLNPYAAPYHHTAKFI